MILNELKSYIFEKQSASRKELAQKFALSEDGVDAMLEVWVKKGRLSRMVDLDKQQNITQVRYRAVNDTDIPVVVVS